MSNLESRIYAQISQDVATAMFNDDGSSPTSGSLNFEGNIIAQAVLIDKTASVAANIAAEVVMCKGKVFGDIRATHKIKITKDAEIKGNINSPNLIIEKGAIFDGRCSMPNIKPFRSIGLFGVTVKRTG